MSSTKRKSFIEAPTNERKRSRMVKKKKEEERHWGYSTNLMIYDDPWKIKKELTKSDLGNLSRLLLSKELIEELVLPVLTLESQREAMNEKGTKISIWDVDTQSMHYLVFKFWSSSRSYVFIDNWTKDFVHRRGLKIRDEIGFHWDPYKNRFDFSILVRA
ncbi:B3 domain-containing protein At2g33720 [Cajanus cajan]|nr:B3 domain-containing protein At2g33720 [Cajanus cajan]